MFGTSAMVVRHRGQGHLPRFLMVAMIILWKICSWVLGMYVAANLLFGVIGRVAIEPGKDPAGDTIWEFDEDPMFVCLRKLPLKNELDNFVE